ncbi:hypothetical protein HK405_012856, partial [Cladochytrium tenue]
YEASTSSSSSSPSLDSDASASLRSLFSASLITVDAASAAANSSTACFTIASSTATMTDFVGYSLLLSTAFNNTASLDQYLLMRMDYENFYISAFQLSAKLLVVVVVVEMAQEFNCSGFTGSGERYHQTYYQALLVFLSQNQPSGSVSCTAPASNVLPCRSSCLTAYNSLSAVFSDTTICPGKDTTSARATALAGYKALCEYLPGGTSSNLPASTACLASVAEERTQCGFPLFADAEKYCAVATTSTASSSGAVTANATDTCCTSLAQFALPATLTASASATASSTAAASTSATASASPLSTATLIGIVVAGVTALFIAGAVVFFVVRKRRDEAAAAASGAPPGVAKSGALATASWDRRGAASSGLSPMTTGLDSYAASSGIYNTRPGAPSGGTSGSGSGSGSGLSGGSGGPGTRGMAPAGSGSGSIVPVSQMSFAPYSPMTPLSSSVFVQPPLQPSLPPFPPPLQPPPSPPRGVAVASVPPGPSGMFNNNKGGNTNAAAAAAAMAMVSGVGLGGAAAIRRASTATPASDVGVASSSDVRASSSVEIDEDGRVRRRHSSLGTSAAESEAGSLLMRAVFDYDGQMDDELSFRVGQIITVTALFDDGWGHGMLDGLRGAFPLSCVVPVEDESEANAAASSAA